MTTMQQLTVHPKIPTALIDPDAPADLRVITHTGFKTCAEEFAHDKRAKEIMLAVLAFLEVRSASWRAIQYMGGNEVPLTRIDLRLQDQKVRIRVGKYVGMLHSPVHRDGHEMTQKELFAKWNLEVFSERLKERPAAVKPVLDLTPPPPVLLKAPYRPMGGIVLPMTPPEEGSFSNQPGKVKKLIEICYSQRGADDTFTKEQIYDAFQEVGGVENSAIRMGRILYTLTQRGFFVALDEGIYGLENKALTMIGVVLPEPESKVPEPPVEPVRSSPAPVAPPPPAPVPVPETGLERVMHAAQEKLAAAQEHEQKYLALQRQIAENEREQQRLRAEHEDLSAKREQAQALAASFGEVENAVEQLRRLLGVV